MYRLAKHLIKLAFGILLSPVFTFADGSVKVSWNPNTENDLAGYRLYYGSSSGNYMNVVNAGNVTAQTISNLSSGATYFFVVTALDQSGNESRPSPEVSATIPGAAPSPLTISAVAASNITTSGVSITWSTNNAANSQVEYGLDANYRSVSVLDSQLVTAHSISLSNLSPNTLYHYRVNSKEASGQVATSGDLTFRTLAAITPPPVPNPSANLALHKPAAASSSSRARTPDKAVDDNSMTYWRNGPLRGSQTAWLRIDLQSLQTVGRAVIQWRSGYHAKKYELQISQDGSTWSAAYTTTSGRGKIVELTFPAVPARYVRLYMTEMNKTSYRVNALEVYAGGSATAQAQMTVVEELYSSTLDETDVEEVDDAIAPQRFVLHQNYPNPFNPRTEISFEMESDGEVVLRIYNALGQAVRTLYEGHQTVGRHTLVWDARDDRGQVLPSGMYLYTLEVRVAGSGQSAASIATQSRTMTLLK